MKKLYNGYTEERWAQICSDPFYKPVIDATLKNAERFMETPPPQLKFTDIHAFVVTGDRAAYQTVFYEYGARVKNFFMAYMYTKDEKYIDPLINAIWNFLDIETWALPAHVREDHSLEYRREFLELCSCNYGRELGELLVLMEDKLPELVVRRLRNELRVRIIDSYKKNDFSWKRSESNWGAVCLAGVFGAYLTVAEEEEIKEQMPSFISTAECFLRGFDDEGCCKEGYAYWHYGFSYFCIFATLLRNYTNGEIDYFKNPKVHNIAKFQENMAINETQCICFSDCGHDFNPDPVLSHLLKTVYPDVQIPPRGAPARDLELHDVFSLNPSLLGAKLELKSFTYHENQWFIHHGAEYSVACKAGCNNEPHNHNDIGSFVFSQNGKVSFTDAGSGQYTRQYFSAERYECLEPSSRSHSVPIINGKYQIPSKEKSTVLTDTQDVYEFTMQNAYSDESLKSLVRKFDCSGDKLLITDKFTFDKAPEALVERFISLTEPAFGDGYIKVGETLLRFDPDLFDVSLKSEVSVRSPKISATVYMSDLTVKDPKAELEFTFTIG